LRLGCAIDWTARVGDQTPDLLVTPVEGQPFFAEVFAVGQGEEREEIQRQRNWVCQQLLNIETTHRILVWDILAPQSRSLKAFLSAVHQALAAADAKDASAPIDDAIFDPENAIVFDQDGVRIEFNVEPHHYAEAGRHYPLATHSSEGDPVAVQVSRTFATKVSKYKFDFVAVIVGVCRDKPMSLRSIERALYGSEIAQIPGGTVGRATSHRRADGLLR
jgi:hypothetical protein